MYMHVHVPVGAPTCSTFSFVARSRAPMDDTRLSSVVNRMEPTAHVEAPTRYGRIMTMHIPVPIRSSYAGTCMYC